ncbi:MAG: MotA/TolQ/ExbB proton channel family protein [Verrucomicrobiales bacterium]|jgi:biopolymer transport protein ExbB|nr:MotA/TolQ/ExbB proton channel family protein [Verrucomicrobiales bacterium]MBP9222402.1 MotA/TolQ/ExbB proton channel family protein [Verrucomicrobiales bacterium]HQZ28256.1 MotA/TolQ/ExbB proton channel family protein [Verrucomicrobiales bacterium]
MFDSTTNAKVWEFLLSGGVFMAFIAICSFVGISVCIHRAISLRWTTIIPLNLRGHLARCGEVFREGGATRFFHELKRSESPVGRIGMVALSPEFETRDEAEKAVEATAREQMVKLENGMGVLEVVITISPLLGLLGTVSGLVSVFATLGGSGDSGDPALIAAGIAVALNTTIAGLVVAVVMVIVHSYFSRRLERIAARLEVIAGHLLHEFFKNGGPQIYLREEAASVTPETGLARAIEESGRELGQPDFLT